MDLVQRTVLTSCRQCIRYKISLLVESWKQEPKYITCPTSIDSFWTFSCQESPPGLVSKFGVWHGGLKKLNYLVPKVLSPQEMKERCIVVGREEKNEANEPLNTNSVPVAVHRSNVVSESASPRAGASMSIIVNCHSARRRVQCVQHG